MADLLVNVVPGETRVALVAGGRLETLTVARRTARSLVADVYLGRVTRIEPGLGGAFVDIGLARAGFLPLSRPRAQPPAGARPSEGAAVTVQVAADPVGEKGPRLTTEIALAGRYLVFTPTRSGVAVSRRVRARAARARLRRLGQSLVAPGGGDENGGGAAGGFILRAAAAGAGAAALAQEATFLRARWQRMVERRAGARPPACLARAPDAVVAALFDHGGDRGGAGLARIVIDDAHALAAAQGVCRAAMADLADRLEHYAGAAPLFEAFAVEGEIEALLERRVRLSEDAALVIDEVEAVTAIDLDWGGAGPGAGAVNLRAAEEIARQLRLRGVAGLVVIDFLRMGPGRGREADRRRLVEALRAALAEDPVPAHVHGFTAAGLMEVTRERRRAPLGQVLTEPCVACGGGRIKTAATVAFEAFRRLIAEARARPGAGLALAAAPAVIAYLRGPGREDLGALEAGLGRAVALRPEPGRARDGFEIVME